MTSGTLWALKREDFRGILMSEFLNSIIEIALISRAVYKIYSEVNLLSHLLKYLLQMGKQ